MILKDIFILVKTRYYCDFRSNQCEISKILYFKDKIVNRYIITEEKTFGTRELNKGGLGNKSTTLTNKLGGLSVESRECVD